MNSTTIDEMRWCVVERHDISFEHRHRDVQEKIGKTKTWCQKEKQCQLSGIITALHVFCVNSALHLLPQREVTQLICLTIYVGTKH